MYCGLCDNFAEPEFCFISDTPMVDGANLTVLFDLRGCADVLCQTTTTDLVDCMLTKSALKFNS